MSLETARALAGQHFRVFPLQPDSKRPAIKKWPERATSDPAELDALWPKRLFGSSDNVAIACGGPSCLAVIDEDNKGNVRGADSIAAWDLTYGIPATVTAITPTGGRHLFFRAPKPLRNSASKIAPGIDVRGEGGYVVAAGSTIDGRPYRWADGLSPDDVEIAELPGWLLAMIEAAQPAPIAKQMNGSGHVLPSFGLDDPAAVTRARDYLAQSAPRAVEGDGGDATTYAVACRVKDFGVSECVCLDLMSNHWNDDCSPPWMPDDLENKVANAYRYGKEAPGSASPFAEFELVAEAAEEAPLASRLRLEFASDIRPDFDRQELVAELLDLDAVSVMYGPSNSGKTFLALDMALHIALGREWHGHRVSAGGVLYIASEGAEGVRRRITAFRKHHGVDLSTSPFALIPVAVNMLDGKSRRELGGLVDRFEKATGSPPVLVVVDTLNRAMPGADENSAEAMGSLIQSIDSLRKRTRGHVLLIHHTGKDKTKGARGHSSLKAAVDTEIEIGDRRVAKITKQRDKEIGRPLGFALESVVIGERADGAEVSTCVVLPRSVSAEDEFAPEPLKPGTQAHQALEVLKRLTAVEGEWAEMPDVPGKARTVSEERWREACRNEGLSSPGSFRKAYQRVRASLERDGWTRVEGERVWLRHANNDIQTQP